jgi:hypothetical protein
MRSTIKISLWLLRIAAIEQLISGILFWSGHAYTFVPLHMVVGSVVVLALWTIAVLALIARVRRGLAVFELAWGLALAAFGAQQAMILIGPMHWIVRVIHLLMAFSAMELGGKLGKAILGAAPAGAGESDADRAALAGGAS